jgi:hypothetical protein
VTVSENENIGVGETDELSLRVSAAALARVVFSRPEDGTRMLALEHKAYVSRTGQPPPTVVKAQPFGGAVRIVHRDRFAEVVGGFSFDSERSREEQDFRIFIRPSHLAKLRDYASQIAGQPSVSDLEIGPSRELEEEFEDTLGINLDPDAYTVHPVGIVWQSHASPTSNLRALGKPTARIYWIYEVEIEDAELCQTGIERANQGEPMPCWWSLRMRSGKLIWPAIPVIGVSLSPFKAQSFLAMWRPSWTGCPSPSTSVWAGRRVRIVSRRAAVRHSLIPYTGTVLLASTQGAGGVTGLYRAASPQTRRGIFA